jgi:hypothetical protein
MEVSTCRILILILVIVIALALNAKDRLLLLSNQHSDRFSQRNASGENIPLIKESPACRYHPKQRMGKRSRIKRIFMIHMRKAGGTTVKSYLREVAAKYNLQFQDFEGRLPPTPFEIDDTTLLVTHIREPSFRVLSHYKYEMRWNCKFLTNKSLHFQPSDNNTRISLESFVERVNKPTVSGPNKGLLWECSHNCYAKWATGLCWKEPKFDKSEKCWSLGQSKGNLLSLARNVLFSYDLVIVIEWLKNPTYVKYLETFFGLRGINRKRTDMWCGTESAKANRDVPLLVSNETMERIAQLNEIDKILYDELTRCKSFSFPNRSIFV